MAVPSSAAAQSNNELYRALLLQLLNSLQLQLEILLQEQTLLVGAQGGGQELEGKLTSEVDVLYQYDLSSGDSVSLITNSVHREYFEEVFNIFPDEYDGYVKKVLIFDYADSDYEAFVETIAPRHETWVYAVNKDVLDDVGTVTNFELVTHELAHIISYEQIDGVLRPTTTRCHEYFRRRGCLSNDMYLNVFVDEFWNSSDLDRALEFMDYGDSSDEVLEYYEDNKDDYVSDYAAFNPEEDFAESFMYYLMDYDTKSRSEAEAKVNFFNTYPKLRRVKSDVR